MRELDQMGKIESDPFILIRYVCFVITFSYVHRIWFEVFSKVFSTIICIYFVTIVVEMW